MKKIFFLFLSFLSFSNFANADTINYWHVYHNQIKIEEVNQFFSKRELVIKIKDIKPTDSLVIEYFRDTPCYKYECYVFIENKKEQIITKSSAVGTGTPIKISLFEILYSSWNTPQYHLKTKESYYQILYEEKDKYWGKQKKVLFRLKLE